AVQHLQPRVRRGRPQRPQRLFRRGLRQVGGPVRRLAARPGEDLRRRDRRNAARLVVQQRQGPFLQELLGQIGREGRRQFHRGRQGRRTVEDGEEEVPHGLRRL